MKTVLVGFILLLMSGFAQAKIVEIDILPDELIMPCTREVPMSQFTKLIVPMMPWRGVNLIFPFKLDDNETFYTLSGSNLWKFERASNTHIVPIYFFKFKNEWGAVQDFTISNQGFVFSMALHAVQEPDKHCTNIKFILSEAEKKRLKAKKKEAYRSALKSEYDQKFSKLEQLAEDKAMLLVSSLVEHNPDRQRIKEESSLILANGDDIIAYVKSLTVYGKFSTLSFDLENNTKNTSIYIKSVSMSEEGEKHNISGVIDFPKKIKPQSQAELVFITREILPKTGLKLVVVTEQGNIEVKW